MDHSQKSETKQQFSKMQINFIKAVEKLIIDRTS